MKKRVRNKIVITAILLIIICLAVMMIPKNMSTDKGLVSEDVEISVPTVPEQEPIIKEEGAITIVLKRIKGAEVSDIQDFSQVYGEGGWEYEGSIKVPKKKIAYEFQIDADMGTILKWEAVKLGQKTK